MTSRGRSPDGFPPPHVTAEPENRILYGRRKGRRLRAVQQVVLEETVPRLRIVLPPGDVPVEPAALFEPPVDQVWLEIGFGAGEHLLAQAAANPNVGFIGCEPFLNGVVRLAGGLVAPGTGEAAPGAVRVWQDDARVLLRRLPDRSLSRVFILFPDPWPKTRHHKRRVISPAVLAMLARTMRDDAELRIATDDPGYLVWILDHLQRCRDFAWTARAPGDWRQRPDDWPATRYEQKALVAGRRCTYLCYGRRARSTM